ncbi:hypothetical protein OG453_25385 [Streptomyces sp. NBC_01381]|uniref:hypothetical protein n=1 Tax=Streptomyces sp. NBC_01381 TaxID=2903845 RepID=UPI00225A865D|nr:hypothetical protein [Streptomyces sp. NBC_01381]MCX4669982.1 hypothetical protein [Streptomyces sp. NBC_01381]
MFEIRILCPSGDVALITRALSEVFTLGRVLEREAPSPDKVRLSITADHRPENDPWPDSESAYALAPSIVSEIGWVAHSATNREPFTEADREFWLRKAALLDRLALGDARAFTASDATELATQAAHRLMDVDDSGAICDPRHYVRREYAAWAKNQ